MGRSFHLSSFMSSISSVPLNRQAQGTSTWLIIGSNSHAAQAFVVRTACHAFLAANAVLPYQHGSLELHSAQHSKPLYSYTISHSLLFSRFVVSVFAPESEVVSYFRAGQRRWEV